MGSFLFSIFLFRTIMSAVLFTTSVLLIIDCIHLPYTTFPINFYVTCFSIPQHNLLCHLYLCILLFVYRLQPVLETREKQLKLWRDLILKYCSATHVYRIVPANFPFFANNSIDRRLGAEGISAVVEFLLQSGLLPSVPL